jgi:IS4 transposase
MTTLSNPKPVYELAGQQTDALAEEVLAVLFTDQPERASVRPGDTRQHQQWLARNPDGASSRGWLSFARPLTADTRALLKERSESALRTAFVPAHASSVTVTVIQTAVNELTLGWTIVRSSGNVSEGAVVLSQGVG